MDNTRPLKPYLVLGVILVLAIVLTYFWDSARRGTLWSEPIACTMEALLCPDGSYVGRSGPECQFSPCPEIPQEEEVFDLDESIEE